MCISILLQTSPPHRDHCMTELKRCNFVQRSSHDRSVDWQARSENILDQLDADLYGTRSRSCGCTETSRLTNFINVDKSWQEYPHHRPIISQGPDLCSALAAPGFLQILTTESRHRSCFWTLLRHRSGAHSPHRSCVLFPSRS